MFCAQRWTSPSRSGDNSVANLPFCQPPACSRVRATAFTAQLSVVVYRRGQCVQPTTTARRSLAVRRFAYLAPPRNPACRRGLSVLPAATMTTLAVQMLVSAQLLLFCPAALDCSGRCVVLCCRFDAVRNECTGDRLYCPSTNTCMPAWAACPESAQETSKGDTGHIPAPVCPTFVQTLSRATGPICSGPTYYCASTRSCIHAWDSCPLGIKSTVDALTSAWQSLGPDVCGNHTGPGWAYCDLCKCCLPAWAYCGDASEAAPAKLEVTPPTPSCSHLRFYCPVYDACVPPWFACEKEDQVSLRASASPTCPLGSYYCPTAKECRMIWEAC
jgi:hypothetical protein